MTVAQIDLSDSQFDLLHSLARETGRTEDELVSEAVDKFISELERSETEKKNWKDAYRSAAGLWKDRDDLPDFEQIRKEWDRSERWSMG